jgi:Tn3 transposase DDE domain
MIGPSSARSSNTTTCLIFHNVCMMTRVLHKLRADGVPVEADTVAALSPYIRSHITGSASTTLT